MGEEGEEGGGQGGGDCEIGGWETESYVFGGELTDVD